jgi:hypothetical protein
MSMCSGYCSSTVAWYARTLFLSIAVIVRVPVCIHMRTMFMVATTSQDVAGYQAYE